MQLRLTSLSALAFFVSVFGLIGDGSGGIGSTQLAWADDRVDFTTTWYQERRRGGRGGLTIIHPQLDLGVDIGNHVSLAIGYSSDVVTGATAGVYTVDAISSATTFEDLRHETRLSIGFSGNRSRLTFTGGAAVERDYISVSASVTASVDLPGKNTNLAVAFTHNFDRVCDRDNTMADSVFERRPLDGQQPCDKEKILIGKDRMNVTLWQDLDIDTAQVTLTQNFTPTVVGQFGAYGQILRGFQANPYRRVRVSGSEPQESVPDVRGRAAITLRVNKYLKSLSSAVHASLRGYQDTWGVDSLTAEMAYSQYVGDSLLLRYRLRLYQQNEAKFFKDAFFYETEGPAGNLFTGDRELGALRHISTGAKLSYIAFDEEGGNVWGVFDEVRFNLKGDLLFLTELAVDDESLNTGGIKNQFLSSDQLLDAFTLQIGVLLRY